MRDLSTYVPTLDKIAISTSTFCALHCLFLPMVLAIFPAFGASLFGQESFHVLLLWLVIPLSAVALSMGCYRHKSRLVLLMGMIGLGILIFAASIGHDYLGETGERIATIVGALFIGVGHFRNYVLCRRTNCED